VDDGADGRASAASSAGDVAGCKAGRARRPIARSMRQEEHELCLPLSTLHKQLRRLLSI